ncbi:Phosphotransferase enzyme family protein [compost metagenome]
MNIANSEILSIDLKNYRAQFEDPDFGLALATELTQQLGYNLPLVRKTEGSSLVFTMGQDYFFKITPPFFQDSIEAEIAATQAIGDQLPFSIPKILKTGTLKDWKFVITEAVPGLQAKDIFKTFTTDDKMQFAGEVGSVIGAINKLEIKDFARSFGPWDDYLSYRLKNCRELHSDKGNSPEWTEKIGQFIDEHADALKKLKASKLIHADLNHEHLMLQKIKDQWKISGVLDFADAMDAPVELEFVLPILCFFKGNAEYQQRLWESSKLSPQFSHDNYSKMMMALALQNRFIEFQDWFSREIKNGATTVEEVAQMVFCRKDIAGLIDFDENGLVI